MAKPTRFKPMKTASGWQLNIPSKYSASGKRERHHYRTRALAQAAADRLKADAAEFGTQAQSIPPALAESAVACMRLLAPFDLSLLEAVKIAVGIKTKEHASAAVGESLDSWLLFWFSHRLSARRMSAWSGDMPASFAMAFLVSELGEAPPPILPVCFASLSFINSPHRFIALALILCAVLSISVSSAWRA